MEQENKEGCKTCKEKGASKFNFMTIIALEIFIVSIYGHLELIKLISKWISSLF